MPSWTGLTSVDAISAFAKRKIVAPLAEVEAGVALLAAAGADTAVVEADTAGVEAADMTAAEVENLAVIVIVIVIEVIAGTEAIVVTEAIAAIAVTTEEESATAASDFVANLIFERPPLCEAFPLGMGRDLFCHFSRNSENHLF